MCDKSNNESVNALLQAYTKSKVENEILKGQIRELKELAVFSAIQTIAPKLPYKETRDTVKKLIDKSGDTASFLEAAWARYEEAMKNNPPYDFSNAVVLGALNGFLDAMNTK